MNPHPELTFRIETLAAAQNRRETELRRVIHERTGDAGARRVRNPFAGLRRRERRTESTPAPAEATASAPCPGVHAHA